MTDQTLSERVEAAAGADRSIHAVFADERARRNLSLRDVEQESGVSFSTLGRFERGGHIGTKAFAAIQAWLRNEPPPMKLPPMALRDRFALAALTGVLASPEGSAFRYVIEATKAASPAPMVAVLAYELADAMLAERSRNL